MKNLFTLTSVTTVSMSVLFGGMTAFAEGAQDPIDAQVQHIQTEGEITFIPGEGEEIEVIPPEGTPPGVIIPPVTGPDGNTGPLTLAYVPTLNFGQQVISTQDQTYYMIPETFKNETGDDVPIASFAQVQDTRGTNAGWDLRVTASEFEAVTSSRNPVLNGAQLSFLNSRLEYSGSPANRPGFFVSNIYLTPGEATPIMTASEGQGAGYSSIIWGNQTDIDQTHLNQDIQLFVPGSTTPDATTYEATLTWVLTAGVGNEIE